MAHTPFNTPKIIHRKSPFALFVWSLTVLAAGFAAGWFAHDNMQLYLQDSIIGELRNEIDVRDRKLDELNKERDTSRQRIIALERAAQIDNSALQELKEENRQDQDLRLKLEEELAFLRGVVSENDEVQGVRIRNFRVSATGDEGGHRFRFTVTQGLDNQDTLEGRILLEVIGTQDGEAKTLKLEEISPDQHSSLKMRFKHFQDVDGLIQLPADFTPKKLAIEIQPDNEDVDKLRKEYDWVVGG